MENNELKTEEYYAVVIWRDTEGKSHIVGTLAFFDGKYYYKYEKTSLKAAREKNFTDIASFNDDEKLYISENSLFNFFKMRVSSNVQETPESIEELIRKRGRSSVDDISVMPIPKVYRPAIKAEIKKKKKTQKENDEKEQEY